MKYQAILFDLDGTLFPISNEKFEKVYLQSIAAKFAPYVEPKHLLKSMWESLAVMMQDMTDARNDEVFYRAFAERIGADLVEQLKPEFDAYYLNEFNILRDYLDDNNEMIEAVALLKDKGYPLVIATNPMFPPTAVEQRIRFSGLRPEDFLYVSNFEKHTRTKPNPAFYLEVCAQTNLDPAQCLMIGNDMFEDVVAQQTGMDAWLITDYLIVAEHDASDWQGSRADFLEKVKNELI